ncbi:hypothetical protein BH09MYX1_BH09MYX1_49950 [soil metagenome]
MKMRTTVDATRAALASVERIRSVAERKGKRLGPPVTDAEMDDRARILRIDLPPSYVAAMHVTTDLGPPEVLLDAEGMARAKKVLEAPSYSPFAQAADGAFVAFDKKSTAERGELTIVEVLDGSTRPLARTFGEWLDIVADGREEAIATAANIPPQLKTLLFQLGFTFDDPIVGRLETGDVSAVEALVGSELADDIRGPHNRLFDSSGKASLTLNVDEYSVACSLRTGIFVFGAEDVFRWLRTFRDESFFGEPSREARDPSRPDTVRDLRRAPREPALVLRGVVRVSALPSARHVFRGASGPSSRDFYALGRTHSTSDRATSLLLHVVGGAVQSAHTVDEPLTDIHVTEEGILWGLSANGSALRLIGGDLQVFPLARPTHGRASYYGIGSAAGRVLVWGAGTLLQFDGKRFAPFTPEAGLEAPESVLALAGTPRELVMLVAGEDAAAVARFDGQKWLPIGKEDVLEGLPVDLDLWRRVTVVLGKDSRIFRLEDGKPRPVLWDMEHEAFHTDGGAPRLLRGIRGIDGGALVASDGGVVVVGSGDPVFYEAPNTGDPTRLSRVGGEDPKTSAILVLAGPHLWMWQAGAMSVLDVRDF